MGDQVGAALSIQLLPETTDFIINALCELEHAMWHSALHGCLQHEVREVDILISGGVIDFVDKAQCGVVIALPAIGGLECGDFGQTLLGLCDECFIPLTIRRAPSSALARVPPIFISSPYNLASASRGARGRLRKVVQNSD